MKVVNNIAFGIFSPLEGFMGENDYHNVLEHLYLENDVAWPIPIVLDVSKEELTNINIDDSIILFDSNENPIALMNISDIYNNNIKEHVEKVYGTSDIAHPGVKDAFNKKEKLVGGEIFLLNEPVPTFPTIRNKSIIQSKKMESCCSISNKESSSFRS